MAFMNQEKKKIIVAAVKPILKKYGVKATFSVQDHMCISLNIKSGKIDFGTFAPEHRGYLQMTDFIHEDQYSGDALSFLKEVSVAMKAADWFDKSDSMTDYFHTAYYIRINVGNWEKPYILEA